MKIVTSGALYIDIDAYAGCVAYAELLSLHGHESRAVCLAPPNKSITHKILSWNAPLYTKYIPSNEDRFILVDVSDPKYFEKFVDLNRVEEVIDHHVGFERYWYDRIGDKAHIEFIGSVCTLIYERFSKSHMLDAMSSLTAKLLVCGILDNTLNFGAHVTSERDTEAYNDILERSGLPYDWPESYFSECQEDILSDIRSALINDTKILGFSGLDRHVNFGQLVIWDGRNFINDNLDLILNESDAFQSEWFLNIISLKDRKSYFVTNNDRIKQWLSQLLRVTFDYSVATADRMWLRKELIKKSLAS